MSLTVRLAKRGDEHTLASLNAVAQTLHVQERPADFKPPVEAEVVAWFEQWLEQGAVRIWIADADSQPVGYAVAMMRHLPESPFCPARLWCELDQIAVVPEQRRRGAARALVQAAIDYAAAEGVPELEATSWSFNETAHRMFEKLGFSKKTLRFKRPL